MTNDWIERCFLNPKRCIELQENDVLLNYEDINNRLYYVIEGTIDAYERGSNGTPYVAFQAKERSLLGVVSFFANNGVSTSTLIAKTKSKVGYIEHKEFEDTFFRDFDAFKVLLPMIIDNLVQRQHCAHELHETRELALKRLVDSEKMASLGQLAAGIAHELNNAVSVLSRNMEWIKEQLRTMIKDSSEDEGYKAFERGVNEGRPPITSEMRKMAVDWQKRHGIGYRLAVELISAGYDELSVLKLMDKRKKTSEHSCFPVDIQKTGTFWELGATISDSLLASRQAAHVVQSVKTLGASKSNIIDDVNVQETIEMSVSLLSSRLRQVRVAVDFKPLPSIRGNKGELVQVWTNLISNAIDSMMSTPEIRPTLNITTEFHHELIKIGIKDNGRHIESALLKTIFDPHITTKANKSTCGMGLGLTIVKQIVESYHGTIYIKQNEQEKGFWVELPTSCL